MAEYGANVAGWLWNAGGILQFVLGTAVLSPREIIAGVINLSASSSAAFFGHKSWGIPTTCALAVVGTALTLYPGLIHFDLGIWGSYAAFVFSMVLGFFNAQLTHHFGQSPKTLLRYTLGNARRFAWLITLASRFPVIYAAVYSDQPNWRTALVVTIWALGDFAITLSKPKMNAMPRIKAA